MRFNILEQTGEIIIPLSKSKLVLMFAGAFAFVLMGMWFILRPPVISNPIIGNATKMFIAGLASIIFFGGIGLLLLKKLFDKTPGLIISETGIFDNASGASAGHIPWSDVVEIRETIVAGQHFVNVIVRNPQEYIDKQKNVFKRKLIQANYDSFGTAIGISANGLKCDYLELKTLLQTKLENFKNKSKLN
jgi:hypothetical protein